MKRPLFIALLLAGPTLTTGCATRIPEPTPADIPQLERALETSPGNPELLTRLGIARYKAGNPGGAEPLLLEATETGEARGAAYLYLGLSREDQEEWSSARDAYTSYIDEGRYGPLKEEIERRLTYIVRQEMREKAQDALARENELAQTDPSPGTVAVFPFQVVSQDQDLMPLQVAVADMMTTDLALSGALTVLERTQVQTLVDEMNLTEAGFTTPETGARAGRLMQAEHVVQGSLTSLGDSEIRFDTDVLNTSRQSSTGEASQQDAIGQLFDLEKETVFQVLDILGVSLTPAEREAIGANRAENLQAFLAYGQGLMAMDRGDFDQAGQFFGQAVQLDPGFGAAQQGQAQAASLQEAETTTTGQVASRSEPEFSPPPLDSPPEDELPVGGPTSSTESLLNSTTDQIAASPASTMLNQGQTPSGGQIDNRDPKQESGGQEGVTTPTTASIRITIPRPGGGN